MALVETTKTISSVRIATGITKNKGWMKFQTGESPDAL